MFDIKAEWSPCGVAVSAKGEVFVALSGSNRIGVYASDSGRFLRMLGWGSGNTKRHLRFPAGVVLSLDGSTLYITDRGNHRVVVWRSDDGSPLRKIGGGLGIHPGELNGPHGCALSPDGSALFVVERDNHRVSVFETRSGRFLRCWGKQGVATGEFYNPEYCACSQDGRVLYVSDTSGRRIVACDPVTGGVLRSFGDRGGFLLRCIGIGSIREDEVTPRGIALSHCGTELYVVDAGLHRVVVFASADFAFLRSWTLVGNSEGIGLSASGRVFVTTYSRDRLLKFS